MPRKSLRDHLVGGLRIQANSTWNNSQDTLHGFQRGDTGQGSVHCRAVEDNIYKILIHSKKIKELSEVEIFILSISACFHDIGKIIDDKSTGWDIDHGRRSYEFLMLDYSKLGLTRDQAYATALIVSVHNNGLLENLPDTPIVVNQSVIDDIKKLAALFRLADMLDTSYHRAPEIVNEIKFYFEDTPSKWLARQSITGWYFDGKDKIILQAIPKNDEIKSVHTLKSLMSEDLKKISHYLRAYNYPFELGELDIKYDLIESNELKHNKPLLESIFPTSIASDADERIEYLNIMGKSQNKEIPQTFTSLSTGIEFIFIPAGKFIMGSPSDKQDKYDDECPAHKVTIKNPFYMGKCPVTQRQWEKVMGSNPSLVKGEDLPIECVSWNEVQDFIVKLNEIENTGKYRLPSESEWEYACRAGTQTRYYFGDDELNIEDYAWYSGYMIVEEWKKNRDKIIIEGKSHPVGQKKPNSWGLYDMHGNVNEWCQDRWHDNYNGAPNDGSAWEEGSSSSHSCRGGSWYNSAIGCRSANRTNNESNGIYSDVSFRVVREI